MLIEVNTFRHLKVLTEEIQTLVKRMEAALYDKNDYDYLHERKKELKKEIEKLKKKKKKLGGKSSSDYKDLQDKLHG
jgi:predicted  nucleic acid-binding Zn-ribbon protein